MIRQWERPRDFSTIDSAIMILDITMERNEMLIHRVSLFSARKRNRLKTKGNINGGRAVEHRHDRQPNRGKQKQTIAHDCAFHG
jgi:hypothetical protein